MAMTLNLFQGYPDRVGRRFIFAGSASGPASYTTGGESLALPGFQDQIDSIDTSGALTVSGTYIVRAIPSLAGSRATWKLKWYAASSPQTEVTAATNLSAEKVIISGKGGTY